MSRVVGNRYRLVDVLGVGGMGVVYAAIQRSLDRVVALKLPRPELANDPRVHRRLRSEALASSRITHRNSVAVYDYGVDDGTPYLAMEHVAGPRLGQVVFEHGRLPLATAVSLVRQIASLLEEAHSAGIVHADIKCDNVLIETQRDGRMLPRVIDWGIARCCGDDDPDDQYFITGTPDYLAPEVAGGARPTFAADVYALGIMLHELICGRPPPAKRDVRPLASVCGDGVPPALDELVLRALSADPAARHADAGVFARALDAALLVEAPPVLPPVARPQIFSTHAKTASMAR